MGYLFTTNKTAYFTFLVYMIVANLGTLNLFIGVFVDIVNKVGEAEEKTRKDEQANRDAVDLLEKIDQDGDKMISIYEFQDLCSDADSRDMMAKLDIDVADLWESGPFLFHYNDDISIDD